MTLLFPTHRPCIYVVDALSLAHHYSLTFVNNISLVSEAAMPMMMLVASTRRSKGCREPAHGGSSWVSVVATIRNDACLHRFHQVMVKQVDACAG